MLQIKKLVDKSLSSIDLDFEIEKSIFDMEEEG